MSQPNYRMVQIVIMSIEQAVDEEVLMPGSCRLWGSTLFDLLPSNTTVEIMYCVLENEGTAVL